MPAVVEPGGTRVGVVGEQLHIFEWSALAEQVNDDGDAEGMGRKGLSPRVLDNHFLCSLCTGFFPDEFCGR